MVVGIRNALHSLGVYAMFRRHLEIEIQLTYWIL